MLWGPYQTFQELVRDDPRCSVANPMFEKVEQPGVGSYLRAGSPLLFDAVERVPPGPSPQMGADTAAVLSSWLDLGDHEIEALASEKVIAAS